MTRFGTWLTYAIVASVALPSSAGGQVPNATLWEAVLISETDSGSSWLIDRVMLAGETWTASGGPHDERWLMGLVGVGMIAGVCEPGACPDSVTAVALAPPEDVSPGRYTVRATWIRPFLMSRLVACPDSTLAGAMRATDLESFQYTVSDSSGALQVTARVGQAAGHAADSISRANPHCRG